MSLSQSVVVASPTLAGCRKEESVVGCVETGVFITAVWDISQLHDNGNGGWARGGGAGITVSNPQADHTVAAFLLTRILGQSIIP